MAGNVERVGRSRCAGYARHALSLVENNGSVRVSTRASCSCNRSPGLAYKPEYFGSLFSVEGILIKSVVEWGMLLGC